MASLRSTPFRTAAAVFGCLGLVLWVQRHALLAFFSSPDDLIHLQQAVGLKPTLPTPLRFLSQVLYFRGMVRLFGLNPAAFHVSPRCSPTLPSCSSSSASFAPLASPILSLSWRRRCSG